MKTGYAVLAVMAWLSLGPTWASEIQPLHSVLSPIQGTAPVLELIGDGKRVSLTLNDLERLPMKETTLKTVFGMDGTFQGVLLNDLLAAYGLKTIDSLTVVASDDYVVRITPDNIAANAGLLATRFKGEPITDPNRGPLILIWPQLESQTLDGKVDYSQWVWCVMKMRAQL